MPHAFLSWQKAVSILLQVLNEHDEHAFYEHIKHANYNTVIIQPSPGYLLGICIVLARSEGICPHFPEMADIKNIQCTTYCVPRKIL